MDKISILNKFDFFHKASETFRNQVLEMVRPATLAAGAYFYHEGGNCSHFAMLGSGAIRVFKTSQQGRQITLYHLREGETCLVNMLCSFLNQASPASAQSESDVEALVVPASVFRDWVNTVDIMRNHVFERMSSRIIEVMMLVEEVAFRKMDQRIAGFLLNRFQSADSKAILRITHEEIAEELGTAREVVSRVLKEFEREGAITIARGQLELLNSPALNTHVMK